MADRWLLRGALEVTPDEAETIHSWASVHCLEFAASDYSLPNIVFDRVDDFIRISWAHRVDQVHVSFSASGVALIDVREFDSIFTSLIREVYELTKFVGDEDDVRVAQLAKFLASPLIRTLKTSPRT